MPKKNHISCSGGFTLIESLLYMALFTIIIGQGMVAAYQIIQATNGARDHVVLQEEANFLLRKIDWALTGTGTISNSQTKLTVTKNINQIPTQLVFDWLSPNLTLQGIKLNSSNITVSNVMFQKTSSGNGIIANFTLTTKGSGHVISQDFSTTKYLRP